MTGPPPTPFPNGVLRERSPPGEAEGQNGVSPIQHPQGSPQPRMGSQDLAWQPTRRLEETADFPGNCRVGLQGLILAFSEVSLALVKHNRYFLSWRGALPARWFRLAALRPLARRVRQPQRSVQQQPLPHRHQAVPGTRPSIRATPAPPPPCSC